MAYSITDFWRLKNGAASYLVLRFHSCDGIAQFVFRGVKMLFCFRTMSLHIVVVRCAGAIHLMDGFYHVVVDCVQVMPIVNPIGDGDSGSE
jgi:hypothetical protein